MKSEEMTEKFIERKNQLVDKIIHPNKQHSNLKMIRFTNVVD